MVKRLTVEEEVKVLKSCDDFVGNGSSRATYFGEYEGHKVAVKVFLDIGGHTQSEAEVNVFENSGIQNMIAEVYAIGHNCIVTEIIDEIALSSDDIEAESYDELEYECVSEEEYWECVEVYRALCDLCGYTSDNAQIGYSQIRDCFVAYDFGYMPESDCSRADQVGNMDDYIGEWSSTELIEEAIKSVNNDYEYKYDYYRYYYGDGHDESYDDEDDNEYDPGTWDDGLEEDEEEE